MKFNDIPSYVISIDNNRVNYLNKVYKSHGIRLPQLINGIITKDNYVDGCSLSHIKALTEIKNSSSDWGVIYEDDAYPINGIIDKLDNIINNLPNDAGCILLGDCYCYAAKAIPWSKEEMDSIKYLLDGKFHLITEEAPNYGAHAYLVHKNLVDVFISLIHQGIPVDMIYQKSNDISELKSYYIPGIPMFLQHSIIFEDSDDETRDRTYRSKWEYPHDNLNRSLYYYFHLEETYDHFNKPEMYL